MAARRRSSFGKAARAASKRPASSSTGVDPGNANGRDGEPVAPATGPLRPLQFLIMSPDLKPEPFTIDAVERRAPITFVTFTRPTFVSSEPRTSPVSGSLMTLPTR